MSVEATILIPTTGDRGALLPYSVGSVLRQTVREIEVFIMGDGVSEPTRQVIRQLAASDDRIRFFDHPKHTRRGEPFRHQALQTARGRIVCYLCDRDLWLPHHVETHLELLQNADFGHSSRLSILPDGTWCFPPRTNFPSETHRQAFLAGRLGVDGLSCASHSLQYYHQLPYGWRVTPEGIATDQYMFQQILSSDDCRPITSPVLTALYFKRGNHPGWPTARRQEELARWHQNMLEPGWCEQLVARADAELKSWQVRLFRSFYTFHAVHPRCGFPIRQVWRTWRKIRSRALL